MNKVAFFLRPDEDDPDAAVILVDGSVGGFSYRFLLDTGAATSSIVCDEYTSSFVQVEKRNTSGVLGTSDQELVRVPNIEFGPIKKQNVLLYRAQAIPPVEANIIGMDFLKDFCCHFFFDEQKILLQQESALPLSFQELRMDKAFHPYVTLHFGETKAAAVWDTGSSLTLVDMSFLQKYPALFQELSPSQGTDATGAQGETPLFLMTAPQMGNTLLSPMKVAGVDLSRVNSRTNIPLDMILGYTTLRQANWVFDFPRHQWAIINTNE